MIALYARRLDERKGDQSSAASHVKDSEHSPRSNDAIAMSPLGASSGSAGFLSLND
jgi:predicted secreted hydrolase